MTNPYLAIPPFFDFTRVLDPEIYHRLPDDWWVGTSDIAGSTQAIANGRYKDVNLVGASIICAVGNVLGHTDFPFMFGGDGAAVIVPPENIDAIRMAMGATARWAQETVGLELRVSLVQLRDIRATGRDVRIARYGVSPHLSYAVFSGRGIPWAEDAMKQGHNLIALPEPGVWPDLSGLHCRWSPIKAGQDHHIVSVIMLPRDDRPAFDRVAARFFELLANAGDDSNPTAGDGPKFGLEARNLNLEAHASRAGHDGAHRHGRFVTQWLKALYITLLGLFLFKTGMKLGGFDPLRYRRVTALNTDFRRFGDGVWMTIHCSNPLIEQIEAMLDRAEDDGALWYGLHRQENALMTCIVPSITSDDHLHFLDGGGGGYTQAATICKQKMRAFAARSA